MIMDFGLSLSQGPATVLPVYLRAKSVATVLPAMSVVISILIFSEDSRMERARFIFASERNCRTYHILCYRLRRLASMDCLLRLFELNGRAKFCALMTGDSHAHPCKQVRKVS